MVTLLAFFISFFADIISIIFDRKMISAIYTLNAIYAIKNVIIILVLI